MRSHGPVLAVVLAITGVPYLLLLAVSLRALRRRSDEAARKKVTWTVLGATLAVQLLYIGGAIADWWDPDMHWAAVRVLIRKVSMEIPLGSLLIWGACLAALWAAYKLAESQFSRLEAPARPEMSCRWWLAGNP